MSQIKAAREQKNKLSQKKSERIRLIDQERTDQLKKKHESVINIINSDNWINMEYLENQEENMPELPQGAFILVKQTEGFYTKHLDASDRDVRIEIDTKEVKILTAEQRQPLEDLLSLTRESLGKIGVRLGGSDFNSRIDYTYTIKDSIV